MGLEDQKIASTGTILAICRLAYLQVCKMAHKQNAIMGNVRLAKYHVGKMSRFALSSVCPVMGVSAQGLSCPGGGGLSRFCPVVGGCPGFVLS
jgi:hypothetical protein